MKLGVLLNDTGSSLIRARIERVSSGRESRHTKFISPATKSYTCNTSLKLNEVNTGTFNRVVLFY